MENGSRREGSSFVWPELSISKVLFQCVSSHQFLAEIANGTFVHPAGDGLSSPCMENGSQREGSCLYWPELWEKFPLARVVGGTLLEHSLVFILMCFFISDLS